MLRPPIHQLLRECSLSSKRSHKPFKRIHLIRWLPMQIQDQFSTNQSQAPWPLTNQRIPTLCTCSGPASTNMPLNFHARHRQLRNSRGTEIEILEVSLHKKIFYQNTSFCRIAEIWLTQTFLQRGEENQVR